MGREELARWIRACVNERGWRQADLAAATGVSQQSASRWMSGKSVPSGTSAQALARALEVPVEEVLDRLVAAAEDRASPSLADEVTALRRRVAELEAELARRT